MLSLSPLAVKLAVGVYYVVSGLAVVLLLILRGVTAQATRFGRRVAASGALILLTSLAAGWWIHDGSPRSGLIAAGLITINHLGIALLWWWPRSSPHGSTVAHFAQALAAYTGGDLPAARRQLVHAHEGLPPAFLEAVGAQRASVKAPLVPPASDLGFTPSLFTPGLTLRRLLTRLLGVNSEEETALWAYALARVAGLLARQAPQDSILPQVRRALCGFESAIGHQALIDFYLATDAAPAEALAVYDAVFAALHFAQLAPGTLNLPRIIARIQAAPAAWAALADHAAEILEIAAPRPGDESLGLWQAIASIGDGSAALWQSIASLDEDEPQKEALAPEPTSLPRIAGREGDHA